MYPVLAVMTALIEKSSTDQALGIFLMNANEHTVLKCDSLFKSTCVCAGTEVLAVNGEAVHSRRQLADIIMAYPTLEFTTHDASRSIIPPFCYLEVAPTSKINPGVSFDSCCDRTLVMISQVFLADLCKTRLRRGDIVLAINGIPVWKPEDADSEQLNSAHLHQSVVLYCVDMNALRDHYVAQVDINKSSPIGDVPREAWVTKRAPGCYSISNRNCVCSAVVNLKTQLLEDCTQPQCGIEVDGGADYAS